MSTKTFGYIRVSTADQNTARQEAKMKALGIDERDIYIAIMPAEKISTARSTKI